MPATIEAPPETTAIDAMAELSAMESGKEAAKEIQQENPKAEPKPVAVAPKKEVKLEEDKLEEKPKADAKVDPKAKLAAEPEKKTAEIAPDEKNLKLLREAREREKSENVKLSAKIKELETKISTSAIPKEFEEKLTARETELRQLKDKLAQKDFTESDDYQTNFYKPYVSTWTRAMQSAMGLSYTDESGVSKTISKEDAEYLLSLPESKMLQEAKRVFGDTDITALTMLSTHKQRIQEAYERMTEARTNAQKLSDSRKEKEGLERGEQSNRIKGLWQAENESYQKTDSIFQEDENDADGNELLKSGLAEADSAFSDGIKPEERLKLHAQMRWHHAAHKRLLARDKAKDEKINELEEELKGFRESEPDTGASANGKVTKAKGTLEELEELDRQNK